MKYMVDIITFTDSLRSMLERHVHLAVASVTDVKPFVEPVIDMIVKSENNPVYELMDMLSETFIPDAVASRFAVREVNRISRQLEHAISYYRHNHGCVVYAIVISDAHCLVEIDNLHSRYSGPPRLTDEERYLNELRQVMHDGGYIPERLRRLI